MPLSISKLEQLLSTKGFIPNKYFMMHDVCVYIEVVSISNADIFMLYVPSKYKFKIQKPNCYKIKYVNIINNDNTVDDYAGKQDDYTLEKSYGEIDLNNGHGDQNMESYLESKYKKKISLKDVSTEDNKEITNLLRQLKRLSFCVQNVDYKLVVLYKNYICAIKRDNEIECYRIKKYPSKNSRKLYISVDLELFYTKIDSLTLNMDTIKKGLYHILDKNQINHTKTLTKLLEEKKDTMELSEKAYQKKQEYDNHIEELQKMLDIMTESGKDIISRIDEEENRYHNPGLKGLHKDIEKSRKIGQLNTELDKINRIKQEIVTTMFKLQTKKENTILEIDKIMFDNTVMLESILKNFADLGKLCLN